MVAREYGIRLHLRQVGKLGITRVPHLDSINVATDQVLQVCRQCPAVDLDAATGRADPLGDVDDDAGEAVLVDVDFLVVWDLAQFARCDGGTLATCSERMILVRLGLWDDGGSRT